MPNAASTASKTAVKSGTAQSPGKSDAVSLLKADHRKVEQLFAQFEQTKDDAQKKQIVRQVCTELIIHTRIEEELFYSACREKDVEDDTLDEAQVEHDGAKVLIADLLESAPGANYYDAKVKTLSQYIKHHVGEEERPRSGIFAKAQKAGVDMAALGAKLQARKAELMAESEALISQPPQPRSFTLNHPQSKSQESSMARYSNDRDRDERGRFTDEENRGYQSRGQGNYRDRDSQGRFTGDHDDDRGNRGGYQSRGNASQERDERGRFTGDYDDDRGGSRGRGHGGWYGDSEGHSRAAQERGNYGSHSGSDDDDRGYSSRGHGNYRDRNEQGRFTSDDDRGYSRSSRDYDDDRSGRSSGQGRGWYGDPEGHSRAAHEGWDERGYSGRQSSNRRDEDDDRRGSHDHGGWFGDSRGHSQAAREGWRNR